MENGNWPWKLELEKRLKLIPFDFEQLSHQGTPLYYLSRFWRKVLGIKTTSLPWLSMSCFCFCFRVEGKTMELSGLGSIVWILKTLTWKEGFKIGFEVGEELGFGRGCVDLWNSAIRVDSTCFFSRVMENIRAMDALLHNFPIASAEDDYFGWHFGFTWVEISGYLNVKLEFGG